jgi:hypothetical protein
VINGLDQGDPFSGICYLLYNADLLNIPETKKGEWTLLFINDTAIIVMGKDFSEMHKKIRDIMGRPGGVSAWARIHNCEFRMEKFQLLDMSRKTIPHTLNLRKHIQVPRRTLTLNNFCILSKETAKFLGVIIDNKMNWKGQCTAALAKGQDWILQFSRITRAS